MMPVRTEYTCTFSMQYFALLSRYFHTELCTQSSIEGKEKLVNILHTSIYNEASCTLMHSECIVSCYFRKACALNKRSISQVPSFDPEFYTKQSFSKHKLTHTFYINSLYCTFTRVFVCSVYTQ